MSLIVDIEKDFGSFSLKVNINQESGVLGFLGESGCGKSMTLKCIAGIVKPDKGKIILNGRVFFDSQKKINIPPQERKVGYLFQNYALFPHMTVKENIEIGLGNFSKEEKSKIVKDYLRKMKLEGFEKRYPYQLSGGQKQRIAFARALACNPEVLILDEPFSALDYHLKSNMENELIDIINDFKGHIVYVTHDISESYRICDDIVVFNKGLAINKRSKKDLFKHPMSMTEAIITGCKNISEIDIIDGKRVFAKEWGIECTLSQDVIDKAKYIGIRAHHMRIVKNNLQFSRENLFQLSVVKVFESSFTYIVYVKNLENENYSTIQLETNKNIEPLKVGDKIFVKFDENCLFDFC
ncbi:MAG: sulfate/molybdate ABC transporter ATP-binding protein [Terrisporobacter othiniensis]|uniref:sulfate/molybdate ABC transporter ATP-binding protein n=1 Tax=Terrisporobacter petrolearius TaxID=1460447 RepID=UPI0022E0DA4F|nr:sulfate/molybdate ABC transporter ATP-binding protein [Terrisporobacter petrolearius]MDU4859395.1 sulfate/molybdate ABC transporter ATP-binding protein [Terrisporobacter othiniensis]MDU6993782.1 sulfate/molybdate ABC transporter ATP-binding protein [Terrisporobacter othiniensis]